jgi:hypothetical protein
LWNAYAKPSARVRSGIEKDVENLSTSLDKENQRQNRVVHKLTKRKKEAKKEKLIIITFIFLY